MEPEKEKVFLEFEKTWKDYKIKEKQAGAILADIYYKLRSNELIHFFKNKLPEGAKILHVACGTGKWSLPLLKQGYKVFHLEISINALKIAKQTVKPYYVYSVRGDAFNLPFKDSCFDAVISFGFFEHFNNIKPLFYEMRRVLKKDGIFFADIAPGKTFITKIERLINFIIYLPYAFLKFDTNKIKNSIWFIKRNYYENNYAPYYYVKIMKEVGFSNIKVRAVRFFPLLKIPYRIEQILITLLKKTEKIFIPRKNFQKFALLKSAVWEFTAIKS